MEIFVIGGVGFQGSYLIELLLVNGYWVIVFDKFLRNVVCNMQGFCLYDCVVFIFGLVIDGQMIDCVVWDYYVVFYLVVYVNVDQFLGDLESFFEINVMGIYCVLEVVWCYRNCLIYVLMCEVYGDGYNFKEGE